MGLGPHPVARARR
eukprot:gene20504-biopygen14631